MTEPKKTTRPRRRSVSLRTDPLDEVAATPPPAPVTPPAPPPSKRRGRAKAAGVPDREVDIEALGPRPGESIPGEEQFKLTVNIPVSLHQRASGVVRYAEYSGEPEEVATLTDLVRVALARQVAEYEQHYNRGEPFPAPKRLRRGRRPSL